MVARQVSPVPDTITPRLPWPHSSYMGLSGTALRTMIGVVAGLCFVAFGYGQGDIGGLFVMESFRREFPALNGIDFPTLQRNNVAGIVVAAWNLGCFVGAMLTIFLGDVFGRKGTILFGLVVMTSGKIVQVSSFSLAQYIAGRVVAGLGNGFIASTVPAWQAECLKTHRRGTLLLVSFGSCITLGLALAYWVDYAFSYTQPNAVSWRAPIGLGMIFMVIPLVVIIWMPESPRYLILCGRDTEAKSVFSALNELPPDDEDIHREFLMVKHTLINLSSCGVSSAFRMGQYRYVHRTILAVCLQIMQQFTGVNLFMQYLAAMFLGQLRFSARMSLLLASCCATEFFLASLVAVIGIDRFWGRRTLTMFGAAGMCLCMTVLCVMAYVGTQATHYAMAAFLFLYCTFFSIGWQGMSWLWAVELIALPTRGPANALATAANWLSNFAVVMATPAMFIEIKWKTYIVFAVTNFFIVPVIYFFYPETGYRSLEEVDVLFSEASQSSNPWLAIVEVAEQEPQWFDKGLSDSDPSTSGRGLRENSIEKTATSAEKHSSGGGQSDTEKWNQYCRQRAGSDPSRTEAAADPPPDFLKRPSEKRSGSGGSNGSSQRRHVVTSLGPGAM